MGDFFKADNIVGGSRLKGFEPPLNDTLRGFCAFQALQATPYEDFMSVGHPEAL